MTRQSTRAMVTFLVRAARDAGGRLHGFVERVKTGEKERFTGTEALAQLIDRMAATNRGGTQNHE